MRETAALLAKINRIPAACEAAAAGAVRSAAEAALAAARSMAPVETGRLRASLQLEVDSGRGAVFTDCEYAAAVELGSRRNSARPFMLPAAQAAQKVFADEARQLTWEALRGGGR